VLYHCGMKKCEVKLQIVIEYNAIVKEEWRKKLEDLGDDPTNVNLKSISEVDVWFIDTQLFSLVRRHCLWLGI
jgi:hypothetical protein